MEPSLRGATHLKDWVARQMFWVTVNNVEAADS